MSFLRDTVKSAGAGLVMTISRFLAMAIIARNLGVEGFGILSISVFSLDLIALFALAGLPGLTSRFLPLASLGERAGFRRFLTFWLAGSVTIAAVSAPVVAFYVIGLDDRLAYIFSAWALLVVVQTAVTAEMQGAMRFDLLAWGNTVASVVLVAGAWILVEPASPGNAFVVLAMTAAAAGLASPVK